MAHFIQRQGGFKTPVIDPLHGDVEPGLSQGRFIFFHFPYNFISNDFCVTNIGAHPGSAGLVSGQPKAEGQQITTKANHPGSRLGVLNYLGILGHNFFLNKAFQTLKLGFKIFLYFLE